MEARQNLHRRIIALSVALLLILTLAGSVHAVKVGPTQAQSFIVQGQSTEAVTHLVEQHGGKVTSRLDIINGVGAELTEASKAALLAEPLIAAITANSIVATAGNAPATDYPDVIGADLAWNEGAMGKGVTVAVIDTGLTWHPGLLKSTDGKLANRIIGWVDFVGKSKMPVDPNGHGTHVAGIIANAEKGADGEWNGVAPGVKLVGVRVLNEDGYGSYEQVIQGVQWAIKNKARYNIRVMNLSLLSPVQSPYFADPLNQAVMKAWASGIVVVVAAGNGGPGPMSVMVPGNNPYVITVGAFTDNYTPADWSDDYIAPFSASGPTLDGFVKPDVVAPGAHIASPILPNAKLVRNHTANWMKGMYFSMAGTSQAAAVVSGVSALILSENPDLTPDQVKYRLQVTALPWIEKDTPEGETPDTLYSMWQMGAGRVNAYDAVFTTDDNRANYGMDIQADLAGTNHYQGFSYYDQATGTYRLYGDFNSWNGAYGSWSGAYGSWSGAYGSWSGAYGSWSGAYGSWSGAYGSWSGAYGSWSGAYGSWSGAYGSWSGAYGSWSGGYQNWNGDEPWAGSLFAEAGFVKNFIEMKPPATGTSSVGQWVEEP